MERLTLDQTWEQCLAMWKWISRQCKGKSERWCRTGIRDLKARWLADNGFESIHVTQDCFLCDRTDPTSTWDWDCYKCPACKIDCDFEQTNYLSRHPNLSLVKQMKHAWEQVAEAASVKLSDDTLLKLISQEENLFHYTQNSEDEKVVLDFLLETTQEALKDLIVMKENEGNALQEDMENRLNLLQWVQPWL